MVFIDSALTWNVFAITFGCLALYLGAFTYEDSDGRLDNYLERLWVSVDDAGKATIGRHVRFMCSISAMTSQSIVALLGSKLWAPQFFVVTGDIGSEGLTLSLFVISAAQLIGTSLDRLSAYGLLPIGLFCLWALWCLWTLFSFVDYLKWMLKDQGVSICWSCRLRVRIAFLILLLPCLTLGFALWWQRSIEEYIETPAPPLDLFPILAGSLLITAFGLFVFFGLVAAQTHMLKWATSRAMSAPSTGSSVIVAAASLACCILWATPLLLVRYGVPGLDLATFGFGPVATYLPLPVAFAAVAATPVALASLAPIAVAVSLAFTRIAWHAIERPVYAVLRHKLIEKKKALIVLGSSLLMSALPIPAPLELLKALFK